MKRRRALRGRHARGDRVAVPRRAVGGVVTHHHPAPIAERLERLLSMPEPNSGCVLWIGSTWSDGSGIRCALTRPCPYHELREKETR